MPDAASTDRAQDRFAGVLGAGRGHARRDGTLMLDVRLRALVDDPGLLSAHAAALNDRPFTAGLPDALAAAYISRQAPGVSVLGLSDRYEHAQAPDEQDDVRVTVRVLVRGFPALMAYAAARYEELWGTADALVLDGDPATVVFEALVASNEMPAPDSLGFELDCSSADVTLITDNRP